MIRLFVYGSLRIGGGNERLLPAGPRQPALTGPGWDLFEFAGGAYPVMVATGGPRSVTGDLVTLDIDSAEWADVEHLERGAGYHLTPIHATVLVPRWDWDGKRTSPRTRTMVPADADPVFTFAWFHADDDGIGRHVQDGDWIAHLARQRVAYESAFYRDARL